MLIVQGPEFKGSFGSGFQVRAAASLLTRLYIRKYILGPGVDRFVPAPLFALFN